MNLHFLNMETGYCYGVYPDNFGSVRYYNPSLSQGLSTGPLAEKYPEMSPYTYTAGNPVMLTDPDGEDPIFGKNSNILVMMVRITEISIW